MLFDLYELPFSVQQAHLGLGLIIGLAFGILAQVSRFCLRRGVVEGPDQKAALGTWLSALLVAVLAIQTLVAFAGLDLSAHRFFASDMPILAILLGGLAFGAGMVLTRGCVSRLTVLAGSGNLRAVSVLLVFALVAHATLKGVFAPIRVALGQVTLALDVTGFGDLPGGALFWTLALVGALAFAIYWLRPRPTHAALAGGIGLLVAFGWYATAVLFMDEFDPMPVQSLAFTSPHADMLFWVIASSSIPAGFGVGLIAGVLGGSFLSSRFRGEWQLQSFEAPSQTLRYIFGGALMGFGGVLAGGCTVGAGLSGVPTLSFAALLALGAIVAGARITDVFLRRTPAAQPA